MAHAFGRVCLRPQSAPAHPPWRAGPPHRQGLRAAAVAGVTAARCGGEERDPPAPVARHVRVGCEPDDADVRAADRAGRIGAIAALRPHGARLRLRLPGRRRRRAARDETPFCVVYDGREIALKRGENLIGRARDCVVRLDSTRVSRHHARITVDDGCGADRGLRQPQRHRGRRRARSKGRVRLKDGDDIGIAGITVLFRVVDNGESTQATEWA